MGRAPSAAALFIKFGHGHGTQVRTRYTVQTMKHIYIATSRINGKGVFAGENIAKGEFVQYIKGRKRALLIRSKEDSLSYPDWIGIRKNVWIDPDYPNQYLNHSCNPNCGILGKVTMVALKDIREGEEITIDYSIIEGDDLWEMRCNCGAPKCRGVIRSIRYLPENTYKRYLPYIPRYFQSLYRRFHDK